jgi:hypothetical protein
MKSQSGALAVKDSYTVTVCGKARSGLVSAQAVGRALGYTEKELTLARDLLKRFAWRCPTEPANDSPEAFHAEPIDSPHDWHQVA